MRALLFHFSKMKHLDLSTCDNDCFIKFYKDVIPDYIVSVLFLFSGRMQFQNLIKLLPAL